ncbi:MAG: EamA family transporter [Candidatus Nanopelagicales bacterium]|nr:EamA family transporter [Candidatus Nanopelagicales bacterium]
MPATRMPVLMVVAAGALFGTAGTAQALGPTGSTPLGVGILRIVVGAAALVTAMHLLGASPRRVIRLWRTPAMLVTASTAGAYQLFFFAGVSRTGVALGTLVAVGSAPLFAGLVGWIALRHRPTAGWVVATVVCLVGLGLLMAPGLTTGSAVGFLLAVGAGMCTAAYNVAARIQLDRGVGALEVPTGSFVLGGALMLPLLLTQPLGWLATPSGAAMALYLGVATMGVANVLLTRGMRTLAPAPATTLTLTDPVVATLLGVIVLGESLLGVELLGVLVILTGLFLQGALASRGSSDQPEPVPVL